MFKDISWSAYFTIVAISLAVYYLYVIARYFSGSIKQMLYPQRKARMRMDLPDEEHANQTPIGEHVKNSLSDQEQVIDEYSEIESLIERIKTIIKGAAVSDAQPAEVKQYFQLLFKDYPSLKKSDFRPAINEMVASECNKLGGVTLGEDEVDMLWG